MAPRYLFDLDNWHISQPPADLAEIDPEGAILAEEAAKLLQTPNDDDDEDSDDGDEDEDKALTSFYTIDAFHWGVSHVAHTCLMPKSNAPVTLLATAPAAFLERKWFRGMTSCLYANWTLIS
jgi:hypothetical protein